MEEVFTKIGKGWTRFNTFLLASIIVSNNSIGVFVWGFIYLELDPAMLCYFKSNPSSLISCTYEDVCTGDNIISW